MRIIYLTQALLAFALIGVVNASDGLFESRMYFDDQELHLKSTASMHAAVFWKLLDIALYSDRKVKASDVRQNNSHPIYIEIVYNQNIAKESLLKVADQILGDLHGESFFDKYLDELEYLNNAYGSVDKGDRYSLLYLPDGHLELFHNGVSKVTIDSNDFATKYLDVWLSDHRRVKNISRRLLSND